MWVNCCWGTKMEPKSFLNETPGARGGTIEAPQGSKEVPKARRAHQGLPKAPKITMKPIGAILSDP